MLRNAIFGISLLAAACADSPDAWRGSVRDSAGVPIVENTTRPIRSESLVVREALRIGTAAGDVNTQFGLIASVDVADDGRIIVLDQQNRQVRVFAPDGSFLEAVGGAGAGPGELSDFSVAALVAPGDTIIVADPGNRRFQRFAGKSPAGDIPMTVPAGMAPNRFALLPDGGIVSMTVSVPTPERPTIRDNLLILVDRTGEIVDTLRRMPGSHAVEYRSGVARFSAYVSEAVWALDAQGNLYSAMSDRWRIEVRDPAGRLTRVIEREFEPRPVTEEDRRAFLRLLRRTLSESNVDPLLIDEMANGMGFADHYPAFAHFLPGPRGTLWVQRIRSAVDAAREGVEYDAGDVGSEMWDVFDAEGRFSATARLPQRYTPLAVHGDRFYGVWRDDLDVQHVLAVDVAFGGP